jgi:hypothetical protein
MLRLKSSQVIGHNYGWWGQNVVQYCISDFTY